MSPSPCDPMREALPWFVGGDLEAAHAAAVRTHLVDCCGCRAEAATLQQGIARLQRAAVSRSSGIDDAFFGDMHRAVMTRVATCEVGDGGGRGAELGRALARTGVAIKLWMPLAAMMLVALGFWAGRGRSESIFDRPPLAVRTTTMPEVGGEPPIVVPWAGDRVPLRLLGEDFHFVGDDADGIDRSKGAGMMGRTTLRRLVDDKVALPRRQ